MNLTPLIVQFVAQSLQRPQQKARAIKGELVCYALAVWLIVAGAVWLLFALFAELHSYYPAPVAALATALATWFVALLLILTAKVLKKEIVTPHESPEDFVEDKIASIIETLEDTLSAVTHQLKEPVRENPGITMLLATVAGFFAARKLR